MEEQVADAAAQKWDYCASKVDYADVRQRVGHAFAEKANEIADAVAIVQGLSKEATRWGSSARPGMVEQGARYGP